MTNLFADATADDSLVVLEGFHAVKHANRFGADFATVVRDESRSFDDLVSDVAPDMAETVRQAEAITHQAFAHLFRHPHPTGIAAVARRPTVTALPELPATSPVVLLDGPRHLGNIGASIRIAAGGGAAGLVTVGEVDPWHATAVRAAAGLHFALPVVGLVELPDIERPLIAFDPDGDNATGYVPPDDAILAFGSERHGLSAGMKNRADRLVAFPMTDGVSSLNLAASVAIGLYMWRLAAPVR